MKRLGVASISEEIDRDWRSRTETDSELRLPNVGCGTGREQD